VSALKIAAGARALDDILCREVGRLCEAGLREPRLLAQPVRVVVPSRSARLHVASLLVRRLGGALLGVVVQPLGALARSLAARSGAWQPREGLSELWVRRFARDEPALAERLDDFTDAYGTVSASVDDLLDAGFEAAHVEASEACLDTRALGDAARDRARALLRVAERSARALEAGAAHHESRLFVRARECLEAEPEVALPARAVIVHGFSDATGVQADLLEALVRLCDAQVLLERPPDPAGDERVSSGGAFGARFRERLAAACAEVVEPEAVPPPARIAWVEAPSPAAEARYVAERLRALLDAGVRAERMAVVARNLDSCALPLRLQLQRLGVPFSGVGGLGPADGAGRRLAVLLDLLARGADVPAERWLEAVERLDGLASGAPLTPASRADLREGLHQLGAARVAAVAKLEPPQADLALTARRGLCAPEASKPARAVRRRLSASTLVAAVRAAAAFDRRCARWPERAALADHLERLRGLVERELGWLADTPGRAALERALFAPDSELPLDFELDRDEFALLLQSALEACGRAPLGGEGGGVQILNAMEARSRSFDQLFVVGVNRGAFPRVIVEDPLLPDDLRTRLRDVLPELPVKREGVDEERHLFAQLLAASPEVTLCWHAADADGAACSPSPLLERLRPALRGLEPERAPAVVSARASSAGAAPRPAHEYALCAALAGERAVFEGVLPLAIEELRSDVPEVCDAEALAAARLAVLGEFEARGELGAAAGPYLGFVGGVREQSDPRRAPIFVTTLEGLARCPWRAFVSRLLRVEPAPDALGSLPSASDALAIGSVVHAALEAIAMRALERVEGNDAPLAERPGAAVAWPPDAEVERTLRACAAQYLRESGVVLPGQERVLALRARPYLEVARHWAWAGDDEPGLALAAERRDAVRVCDGTGADREIHFRADRVDRAGGVLRFTDYKTGRPLVTQRRPATRAGRLAQLVARGEALQAVAYARAGGPAAAGRYLFLRPDLDDALRVLDAPDGGELVEPFERAVATLLAAWDAGSFPPRLLQYDRDEEPAACARCDVKQACLRGDSGARLRVGRWMARLSGEPSADLSEAAAARIWQLAGAEP
jgi:superfamily I DNA/RNA helicase